MTFGTCLILLVMTDGSLARNLSVSLKDAGKPLRYARVCMRVRPGASLSVVCVTHNNKGSKQKPFGVLLPSLINGKANRINYMHKENKCKILKKC